MMHGPARYKVNHLSVLHLCFFESSYSRQSSHGGGKMNARRKVRKECFRKATIRHLKPSKKLTLANTKVNQPDKHDKPVVKPLDRQ